MQLFLAIVDLPKILLNGAWIALFLTYVQHATWNKIIIWKSQTLIFYFTFSIGLLVKHIIYSSKVACTTHATLTIFANTWSRFRLNLLNIWLIMRKVLFRHSRSIHGSHVAWWVHSPRIRVFIQFCELRRMRDHP